MVFPKLHNVLSKDAPGPKGHSQLQPNGCPVETTSQAQRADSAPAQGRATNGSAALGSRVTIPTALKGRFKLLTRRSSLRFHPQSQTYRSSNATLCFFKNARYSSSNVFVR